MPVDGDHLKSILRDHPDRIPVKVGILPAAWMKYRETLDDLRLRHPDLFPDHTHGKRDYGSFHMILRISPKI